MTARICSVAGCDKPSKRSYVCPMHVKRMLRYGSYDLPEPSNPCGCGCGQLTRARFVASHFVYPTLEERFHAGYVVDEGSGCWVWQKRLFHDGYGQIRSAGNTRAHRVAWELLRGPIPPGLVLDHLCRNRACVNPDHLEPVTRSENAFRGVGGAIQSARAAERVTCPKGHPWDAENTQWEMGRRGRMRRRCRACRAGTRRIATGRL